MVNKEVFKVRHCPHSTRSEAGMLHLQVEQSKDLKLAVRLNPEPNPRCHLKAALRSVVPAIRAEADSPSDALASSRSRRVTAAKDE